MRIRVYSLSLRKRAEALTRKQKMESRRRGKRKSPSKAIIFEISDDDMSSGQSEDECCEPEAKILKTDGDTFSSRLSENSNLENDTQILSSKISIDEDNSIEFIECISTSNTSTIENLTNTNDTIIPKVNPNTLNANEVDTTISENSLDNIVDVTEEIPNPLKEEDFTLEEGELADVHTKLRDQVDTTESKPCICITFSDEQIAEIYKLKFLKFIQSFVELEVENYDSLTINIQRDSDLNPNEWIVLDETMCLSEITEAKEMLASPLPTIPVVTPSKKKKKKRGKKEKDLFILDTQPSTNESVGYTKYSSKFQIDIEKTAAEEEPIKISAQTCFNCDSNHAIKDCPLPKDFVRINAARQKFRAQKQSTSRYHLEEDQKYGHLVPGQISEKLRQAMGLRKNQLPPYIYHMRLLGYPPGWLEEAKFVHSNLAMFDSDGNNVQDRTKKEQGLDPAKIVNYPGFNVPIGKDIKDEYRRYQVPPFSENFSKKTMIEFFEKQFAKQQDDLEACDMDLDNTFEESTEKVDADVEIIPEKVVRNPLITELKDIDSNMPSPSLMDLEKQKENLLAALDDSFNPKSTETTCDESDKVNDPEILLDIEKPQSSKDAIVPVDKTLEIDVESAQDSSMSYLSPPLNSSVNSVKNSNFGTPILKSNSPYSQLPNPDNFMKDVSPVINFENLPNSTGKYEQMTGVLQKVRSTLKNLQNCKS